MGAPVPLRHLPSQGAAPWWLVPVRGGETQVDNDFQDEIDPIDTWATRLENHIDHLPVIDE
jgi:hypothetical protein